MKCLKINELLHIYIDHKLDDAEVKEIEEHLASCESCREELELIKKCVNHTQTVEKLKTTPCFERRLNERIEKHESTKNIFNIFQNKTALAALTFAVFVIAGTFIIKNKPMQNKNILKGATAGEGVNVINKNFFRLPKQVMSDQKINIPTQILTIIKETRSSINEFDLNEGKTTSVKISVPRQNYKSFAEKLETLTIVDEIRVLKKDKRYIQINLSLKSTS